MAGLIVVLPEGVVKPFILLLQFKTKYETSGCINEPGLARQHRGKGREKVPE